MNNIKIGYEDTDKKIEIEIYGLDFEIKITEENLKELKNAEKNELDLEKQIDLILGNGAVEKLNKKRISDGYDKLTLDSELKLLGGIFEIYANNTADGFMSNLENTARRLNEKVGKINNYSHNNYNRNNRDNRYDRNNRYNNYRRY